MKYNIEVGIKYPYDETIEAFYKLKNSNELTEEQYYSALSKIEIDTSVPESGIPKEIKVDVGNKMVAVFELTNQEKSDEMNARYLIEWYHGEIVETDNGEEIKKIGNVNREVFSRCCDFVERIGELDAVDGDLNIITNTSICTLEDYTPDTRI